MMFAEKTTPTYVRTWKRNWLESVKKLDFTGVLKKANKQGKGEQEAELMELKNNNS